VNLRPKPCFAAILQFLLAGSGKSVNSKSRGTGYYFSHCCFLSVRYPVLHWKTGNGVCTFPDIAARSTLMIKRKPRARNCFGRESRQPPARWPDVWIAQKKVNINYQGIVIEKGITEKGRAVIDEKCCASLIGHR
jgi:hypothetical protein